MMADVQITYTDSAGGVIPDPAMAASIARKEEALARLRERALAVRDIADLLILLGY